MRHRRTRRVLVAALLAPTLVAGMATGASAAGGVSPPGVGLGIRLDDMVAPDVSVQVCPTTGAASATCDQAYPVVQAALTCVEPYVTALTTTSRRGCTDLVPAATGLVTALGAQATACASGENATCAAVQETALAAARALLACSGAGDSVSVTGSTRASLIPGGDATNLDLYELCAGAVAAGVSVAQTVSTAVQACVDQSDANCAAVVATVRAAANATLACMGSGVVLEGDTGGSLVRADLADLCRNALMTAQGTLALVVAMADDCLNNPNSTCRGTMDNAAAVAAQVVDEATQAGTEAQQCLTGQGDATGDVVRACQLVQDRIGAVLGSLDGTVIATPADEDGEYLAHVGYIGGQADIEYGTKLSGAYTFASVASVDPIVSAVSQTVTVMDGLGNTLNETRSTVTTKTAQTGKFACILNGDELRKSRIVAHPPQTIQFNDQGVDMQYQIHPYQSEYARKLSGLGWTWQVEMCLVGGAQTFKGWRLLRVGIGVTALEAYESLAGHDWSNGSDEPSIEATLSMNVAPDGGGVSVGATASQKATGVNTGAQGTRMPKEEPKMDAYRHNTVLSRWDHVCAWYVQGMSKLKCGSTDYQASITQALYEWPRTSEHSTKTVRWGMFGQRRCGDLDFSCPE